MGNDGNPGAQFDGPMAADFLLGTLLGGSAVKSGSLEDTQHVAISILLQQDDD